MPTDFRKKPNWNGLWPLNTHVSWLVSFILSRLLPIPTKMKSSLTGAQSHLDKVHKRLERFSRKSEHESVRWHNKRQVAFLCDCFWVSSTVQRIVFVCLRVDDRTVTQSGLELLAPRTLGTASWEAAMIGLHHCSWIRKGFWGHTRS